MTPPGPGLDERAVELLLTGGAAPAHDDLQQAVTLVRRMGSGPAPQPTSALAQLLDTGFRPGVVPLRRTASRRTWAARAGAGLSAAVASLVLAGTAQALPPAVQDGLADLVGAVTPFEIPRSGPEPEEIRTPATTRETTTPSTTTPPGPAAPAAGPTADEPRDERGDEQGDDLVSDRTLAERQARDRQRAAEEAAEESADAAEDAADERADEAEDAAEDAARAEEEAEEAREDAARDAARADEEAAEEAVEQAERDADDAERER